MRTDVGRLVECVVIGLLLGAAPAAAQPAAAPLTPEELVQSVDRTMPLIEQARRDVDSAAGSLTSARGAFDLTVSAYGQRLGGEYENDRFSSLIEQPLAPWGISTYGGYRAGRGTFAAYDGKAETNETGELLAGIEVPLLRGREIDTRRADRQVALLGIGRAQNQLDASRLTHFATALNRYWDWVAAGRQLEVARALLALAEARDQQLADAVGLGQIAPIERTDNQRAIFQRRAALISAQRLVEQRAIDVSLYYRGPDGTPVRPSTDRLPVLPEGAPTDLPHEDDLVRVAFERRPEIAAGRLRRDQERVDLQLAENTVLPSLNFFSEVIADNTDETRTTKSGSSFEVGLSFKLPVQRRKAIGETLKARAALAKADLDLAWVQDRVRADVQDAFSAVRASAGVLDAARAEVVVARELEQLERDRFDLGDSTQFLVNLRELATADAAVREARARADFQKALVGLEASTGRLLTTRSTP